MTPAKKQGRKAMPDFSRNGPSVLTGVLAELAANGKKSSLLIATLIVLAWGMRQTHLEGLGMLTRAIDEQKAAHIDSLRLLGKIIDRNTDAVVEANLERKRARIAADN